MSPNERAHEIMALFILHILQMCMPSHPVGLDLWFLIGLFIYLHISCVWTLKALSRLRECAGSPEPSLVPYVISNIITWAGSNDHNVMHRKLESSLTLCGWLAVWVLVYTMFEKTQFCSFLSDVSHCTPILSHLPEWPCYAHLCLALQDLGRPRSDAIEPCPWSGIGI